MRFSAPIVAIINWLIPGSGYLCLGQIARGLTIGITVIVTFALGIIIGGAHVVSPPDFESSRHAGNIISNHLHAILQKPWYIGQFLAGLPGLAASYIGPSQPSSHGLANEYGTLYTAIAGMFNLLGCIDSACRASDMNAMDAQSPVAAASAPVGEPSTVEPAQKQGE